jgi:hypothetical protein
VTKPGRGRFSSQSPISIEERAYWAIQRVLDAARALKRDPEDRALVMAVTSRVREYDEMSTAEERRGWREAVDRRAEAFRRALRDGKRGRPRKESEIETDESEVTV